MKMKQQVTVQIACRVPDEARNDHFKRAHHHVDHHRFNEGMIHMRKETDAIITATKAKVRQKGMKGRRKQENGKLERECNRLHFNAYLTQERWRDMIGKATFFKGNQEAEEMNKTGERERLNERCQILRPPQSLFFCV